MCLSPISSADLGKVCLTKPARVADRTCYTLSSVDCTKAEKKTFLELYQTFSSSALVQSAVDRVGRALSATPAAFISTHIVFDMLVVGSASHQFETASKR